MKILKLQLLIILGLVCTTSFAQVEDTFSTIVEAEMKAAAAIQNFQVNPNTQDYDITHHTLNFTVDPAVYYITGEVTTTFTALADMTTVTFDLTNELTVSSVTMNGTNLSFSQASTNELVITLPTTLNTGSSATVIISYAGAPATAESAFTTSSHNGIPILWTLSEPFGAKDWWPCKQDLNDKTTTLDVYITAPDVYTSVANGMQQSVIDNGNGTKTTHFHHSYPIPAYLIAIAVTNYQIYNQTAGISTSFPIVNYIYPENATTTQNSLAVTIPIMNLFETLFEPYPFNNEKYGHAQFGWGGGMEHSTVSFMGSWSRHLIAHELAHQWFGDKITCGTWKDIWLNEGFAEYLSGLVVEHLDSEADFVNWKNSKINHITSQANGAVYLTDTEAENVSRIFSGRLTYNKGAMVVHMLRWKMGDTAFYQGVQNYLADTNLAYAYAITTDLISHLETAYGSSLSEFFNDWLYNQGYPTYAIEAQNWGAGLVKITVNQTQSDPSVTFFEMPLEIELTGAGGQTHTVVVDNTYNAQEFVVATPFVVTDVVFDPNKNIISRNNTAVLSNNSFTLDEIISIYPNPTENKLHIQLPTTVLLEEARVYNTIGQLITTTNTTSFSVEQLQIGTYIIEIITSEGSFYKNFLKK